MKSNTKRLNNVTIVKPIRIKTTSKMINQDKYKWNCSVSSDSSSLNSFVSKIEFSLHESFIQPHRVIFSPNKFEINEEGWGEFTIIISIYFKDSKEVPIVLEHFLKLKESSENEKTETVIELFNSPIVSEVKNLFFVCVCVYVFL